MFLQLFPKETKLALSSGLFIIFSTKAVVGQTFTPNLPKVPIPVLPPETPIDLPSIDRPSNPLENIPIPLPNLPEIQGDIHFRVNNFRIIGNSAIKSETLKNVVSRFLYKKTSLNEILEARTEITKYYIEHGFTNSRAFILIQDNQANFNENNAVITIRCVEGILETINVIGASRNLANLIKERLKYKEFPIVNIPKLEERIRLLKRDYPFREITGEFVPGSEAQNTVLNLKIEIIKPISIGSEISNDAPESVGTLRESLNVFSTNALGIGEKFNIGVSRTDGSQALSTGLLLPFNNNNGTFSFNYSTQSVRVIQKPYDQLNITSATQDWSIRLRQPILRTDNGKFFREVAVGLTVDREQSQTSLNGVAFQLSQGADLLGITNSTTLGLFADYSFQSSKQFLGLRSELRIGLPIGATINPTPPDGEFYKLNLNALWGQKLNDKFLFVAGGDLQIAERPLIQSQQFGFGGMDTIPGYPTNSVYTDNGFQGKIELHYLAYSGPNGRLEFAPFFALGIPWSVKQVTTYTPPSILASTGISVQYSFSDYLDARLVYGFPIFKIDNFSRTIQSQGLVFTLGLRF